MNQKSSERAPPTHCKWSAADDHFLMNNWGRMHIDDLTRSLGRTRRGVYARAGKLGLSRPSAWPKEHDQMLRKRYEDEGPRALAAALGRTEKAVGERARKLGLRMRPRRGRRTSAADAHQSVPNSRPLIRVRPRHDKWTRTEDDLLRDVVGKLPLREIHASFFNTDPDDPQGKEFSRSYAAVAQRCGALGITLSRQEAARGSRTPERG